MHFHRDSKIERGTENLALANREDVPGISRLLAGWRDEEAELKEKLEQAHGEGTLSPQAIQIMAHLDELMTRLSEANREKLAFAIRQSVKRITLRRERRGDGKHRITLWDGAIELRDELGTNATLALTDDDIPDLGRLTGIKLVAAPDKGDGSQPRHIVTTHWIYRSSFVKTFTTTLLRRG